MKRGNLLWTGSRMMLSEHRQLLNQRMKEEEEAYQLDREWDQQQFEEWQEIWNQAITNHEEVTITLGCKTREQVTGKIVDWNAEQGDLYLQGKDGERKKIAVNKMIDLKLHGY